MGLKDKLLDKTVFIDTALLIYFIEGHSEYYGKLLDIFKANDQKQITFLTSTLTLLLNNASVFLTNDADLKRVAELEVLTLVDN